MHITICIQHAVLKPKDKLIASICELPSKSCGDPRKEVSLVMASFYDITIGQQVEFQRVLASAGFTDSHIARIIKEPNLASTMYVAIQLRTIVLSCCGESITVDDRYLTDPWQPKSWFRGYRCQRITAEQHWPSRPLPEAPRVFIPRTSTEHPLGHVPDSFDSLWDMADAPQKDGVSYTKYRGEGVKSDRANLHLAPNKIEFTEPAWLAFDPERGKGERPNRFWGQADCAASEIFSALIQFPEWPLAWFAGSSAPNLSGYQLKYDGNWSGVPCLSRWDDHRQLWLFGSWADGRNVCWSSPSVREC